jgi:hypothetical protein
MVLIFLDSRRGCSPPEKALGFSMKEQLWLWGKRVCTEFCFSAVLAEKSEGKGFPVCLKQCTVIPSAGTISLKCLQTVRRVISHVMQWYVHSLCWTLLENATQAALWGTPWIPGLKRASCLSPLTDLIKIYVLCSRNWFWLGTFFPYNLYNRALLCLILTGNQEFIHSQW